MSCQLQFSSKRNVCYGDLWDITEVQIDACFHLETRLAQFFLLQAHATFYIQWPYTLIPPLYKVFIILSLKFILNLAYYHSLVCFWSWDPYLPRFITHLLLIFLPTHRNHLSCSPVRCCHCLLTAVVKFLLRVQISNVACFSTLAYRWPDSNSRN